MTSIKLIDAARKVVEQHAAHRYDTGLIYQVYNLIKGTKEKPQTCPSCLIRRAKEVEKWLAKQPAQIEPGPLDTEKPQPVTLPAADGSDVDNDEPEYLEFMRILERYGLNYDELDAAHDLPIVNQIFQDIKDGEFYPAGTDVMEDLRKLRFSLSNNEGGPEQSAAATSEAPMPAQDQGNPAEQEAEQADAMEGSVAKQPDPVKPEVSKPKRQRGGGNK